MAEKGIWVGRALKPTPIPIRELITLPAAIAASHLAAHVFLQALRANEPSHRGHAHAALDSLDYLGADIEVGLQAKGLREAIASAVSETGPVTWDSWDQRAWMPFHSARSSDPAISSALRVVAVALLHVRNIARYGWSGDVNGTTGLDDILVLASKRRFAASRLNAAMSYEPRVCDFCWRTAVQQRGVQSACHLHAGREGASARKRALRLLSAFPIDTRSNQLFEEVAQGMDRTALAAAVSHESYLRRLSAASLSATVSSMRAFSAQSARENPPEFSELLIPDTAEEAWPVYPAPPVPNCDWSAVLDCLPLVRRQLEQQRAEWQSTNVIDAIAGQPEQASFLAIKLHAWLAVSPYNALTTLARAETWLEADQAMKGNHGGRRAKVRSRPDQVS